MKLKVKMMMMIMITMTTTTHKGNTAPAPKHHTTKVSGQLPTPDSLTPKKGPLDRRLGGCHSLSEHTAKKKKTYWESNPRCPACGQSLYLSWI